MDLKPLLEGFLAAMKSLLNYICGQILSKANKLILRSRSSIISHDFIRNIHFRSFF